MRKAVGVGTTLVASGGLRTGLDVAKALALGADLGGLALPIFKAGTPEGGFPERARPWAVISQGLVQALVLTGSRTPAELREQPRVVTGELKDWLPACR